MDLAAAEVFGIGATRIQLRSAAARGELEKTPLHFEPCQSLDNAGVLLLLPFLLSNGLLSYKEHYENFHHVYYDLDFTILLVSFMFLCRIKNASQLQSISSGEFGKLLGVDRVPESKCFYKKISAITEQQKASSWNDSLSTFWIREDETIIFYVDGHVEVYHGHKAHLGKKHVSRQKLCLPGITQYWINNSEGLPYLYINAEVNEKLQEMLETKIIPLLKDKLSIQVDEKKLEEDKDLPRFTVVFDREAYCPKFFEKLWKLYRVAVITYRKNVKDRWDESDFKKQKIEIEGVTVEMELCEKEVELDGVVMREIRKKSEEGHQTSVITTNRKLSVILIAIYMFARWSQENFFRYMRQEYDLDRMYQYIVEQVDKNMKVVNPKHSKLTKLLKKLREKIARRKAKLYQLEIENATEPLDKTKNNLRKQVKMKEELDEFEKKEKAYFLERKEYPYKIKIMDMPKNEQYDKLPEESKHFLSIIKMICYRAETSFISLIPKEFRKMLDERRALVKKCIKRKGDIIPNYETKTLTVRLYTMSTPRENFAVQKIIEILNDSETKFPGTELTMIFEVATS